MLLSRMEQPDASTVPYKCLGITILMSSGKACQQNDIIFEKKCGGI